MENHFNFSKNGKATDRKLEFYGTETKMMIPTLCLTKIEQRMWNEKAKLMMFMQLFLMNPFWFMQSLSELYHGSWDTLISVSTSTAILIKARATRTSVGPDIKLYLENRETIKACLGIPDKENEYRKKPDFEICTGNKPEYEIITLMIPPMMIKTIRYRFEKSFTYKISSLAIYHRGKGLYPKWSVLTESTRSDGGNLNGLSPFFQIQKSSGGILTVMQLRWLLRLRWTLTKFTTGIPELMLRIIRITPDIFFKRKMLSILKVWS